MFSCHASTAVNAAAAIERDCGRNLQMHGLPLLSHCLALLTCPGSWTYTTTASATACCGSSFTMCRSTSTHGRRWRSIKQCRCSGRPTRYGCTWDHSAILGMALAIRLHYWIFNCNVFLDQRASPSPHAHPRHFPLSYIAN